MINWTNFEKSWRNEGEINIRRLAYLLSLNGSTEQDPYIVTELLYSHVGMKNILKRRVGGVDMFSLNENSPKITQWLSFEKEWYKLGNVSKSNLLALAKSFGINVDFQTIFKRYSRRISRSPNKEIEYCLVVYSDESAPDNSSLSNKDSFARDNLKGL